MEKKYIIEYTVIGGQLNHRLYVPIYGTDYVDAVDTFIAIHTKAVKVVAVYEQLEVYCA